MALIPRGSFVDCAFAEVELHVYEKGPEKVGEKGRRKAREISEKKLEKAFI